MARRIFYLSAFLIILNSCRDKQDVEIYYHEIEKSIENNDLVKAKNDVTKLLSLSPENSNGYMYLGIIERRLQKNNEAMLNFKKSITIDSNNYKTYIERAKLKIELGDFNSSILDCNKAISINKKYFEAYKTKGISYELLEDIPNAIIQFESAINYGDLSGETYYKLGIFYLSQGNNEKGCILLSKAGELGYMDAFDIIRNNCNNINNQIINDSIKKPFGQFKSYPNRYSITFPADWYISEVYTTNKSILAVTAAKDDNFMGILEFDPKAEDPNFKAKSVYEINKEEFLSGFRQQYDNFNLLTFNKKRINGIDSYYFMISYKYFSNNMQKTLSGKLLMYVLLNPRTEKLYYLQGIIYEDDIFFYEQTYHKTFETFKFL